MAGNRELTVGYTVELWAARPAEVIGALAAANPSPPPKPMPDETRDAWAELAPVVAGALRQGGGRLVAEYANYVATVIQAVGHHYGSLDHTSSGGDEFRRRFLSGPAATRYGRETVAHLMVRDLGGLTWEEYPRLGHLTTDEVMTAAHRIPTGPPDGGDHPEDITPLMVLDGALTRAAHHRLELHAIYG